jgi:hypothetical protein
MAEIKINTNRANDKSTLTAGTKSSSTSQEATPAKASKQRSTLTKDLREDSTSSRRPSNNGSNTGISSGRNASGAHSAVLKEREQAQSAGRKFRDRVARVRSEITKRTKAYASSVNQYNACQSGTVQPNGGRALACAPPTAPNLPALPERAGSKVAAVSADPPNVQVAPNAPNNAAAPRVVLDPQTAAYMAVAKLKLTALAPGIGPPPDLNKWGMAAVGYPLWLWAEGNNDPLPVNDSVFDLFVSLDPRVARMEFVMGDGNTITCPNVGTKWYRGVAPGKESPTCGYRYKEPSLPKGSYTVIARTYWAVDWNINGQTGTIPLVQSSSTDLPVGELQVLVR